METRSVKNTVIMWAVLLGVLVWVGAKAGMSFTGLNNLSGFQAAFMETIKQPFSFAWTEYSGIFLIIVAVAWCILLATFTTYHGKFMAGREHGSAELGDPVKIGKKYECGQPENCAIVSWNVRMNLDCKTHNENLNMLVVGGPGSGKSRFFVKPNILQGNANFIITDPSGELLRDCGGALEKMGYRVLVFNTVDMTNSNRYNPFRYIRKDTDVMTLIENLMQNTKSGDRGTADAKFWEDSERALYQAIIYYLWYEAPAYEQNFSFLMYLLDNSSPKEEDENFISPLDLLFKALELQDPEHIAVRQYAIYKTAQAKTAKSILLSCKVRLSVFNIPAVRDLTSEDELEIERLADGKVALFCIIPELDKAFNFLVGILYTQITQILYPIADQRTEHLRHLRFIMDEFANIALPSDFSSVLNTARKRDISLNIIIQNFGQLEKLFNKEWEGILESCSTTVYLGSNGKRTNEYISSMCGKATIDYITSGKSDTRLNSNKNITGRELFTPDELRRMKYEDCIVLLGREKPMKDKKFRLEKHKNYPLISNRGTAPYQFRVARGQSLESFINNINLNNYVFASGEAVSED